MSIGQVSELTPGEVLPLSTWSPLTGSGSISGFESSAGTSLGTICLFNERSQMSSKCGVHSFRNSFNKSACWGGYTEEKENLLPQRSNILVVVFKVQQLALVLHNRIKDNKNNVGFSGVECKVELTLRQEK